MSKKRGNAVELKFNILLSCMHQSDMSLIKASKIKSDTVIINQSDKQKTVCDVIDGNKIKMVYTPERGLSKSRNMAIRNSDADICLLCDDDEIFADGYEQRILKAYEAIPDADVIAVKMVDMPSHFPDKVKRLGTLDLFHISSWQISFRRSSILNSGVWFDELLGAGTGNGAEEELKFLTDCKKAGLKIYYAPVYIATAAQKESTWFSGFSESFFENRGASTRYILGFFFSSLYAFYYILTKKSLYKKDISAPRALKAIFRGILTNKISKQKRNLK